MATLMTLARLSFLASVFYKYRLRLQSRGSLSARWTQVPLCLAPVAAFKFPSLRHKRTHDHDHHHDPDSNSDETFTPHKSVLEPETETELGDLLELHPQADPTTAVSALRLPDESSLFTPAGGTGLGASSALVDVATEQTGEGMLAKQRQRLSALNARIEKARTRTENKILDGRTPEAVKAEAVRELRREEGNGGDGENGVSGHVSEGESVDKFERLFAPPSPLQKVEDAEKEREKGRVGGSGAEGAGESTETIGGGAKMTTKTADQRPPSVRHEPTAPHTSDTTRDHTAHPQHSHGSNEPLMTHQSHGTGVNHTGASHGTDVHDTGASHTHGAHEGTSTQTPAPSTTLKPTASDSRLTVGLSEEEQAADIGAGSGASVEGGGTGAATTASSKKDQKRLQEEIKELQKNEVVNRPSDTKEEEKGRRAGAALLRNRGDTVLARRVGRSDSHTDRNIERESSGRSQTGPVRALAIVKEAQSGFAKIDGDGGGRDAQKDEDDDAEPVSKRPTVEAVPATKSRNVTTKNALGTPSDNDMEAELVEALKKEKLTPFQWVYLTVLVPAGVVLLSFSLILCA